MSRALGDHNNKGPAPGEARTDVKKKSRRLSTLLGADLLKSADLASSKGNGMKADLISNIPHTYYHSLTGARRNILLLASDGLGEEKDARSSLKWVAQGLEKGIDATHLARQLAEKSGKRSADNSTVVIVVFEQKHLGVEKDCD